MVEGGFRSVGVSSIYCEWTTRMVSNIDTRPCLRILTSGAGGCWRRPRREALVGAGSGLSPRSRGWHVRPLAGVSGNSAGRRRRASPAGFAVPVAAGCKPETEKQPELLNALEALVEPTARGDPERPLRWTSKSCRRLANALKEQGFSVSRSLVGSLLEQLGYTLQGNAKSREGTNPPDRDDQHEYINGQVADFLADQQPVISVDTKKKELVGDFRNGGREWRPKGRPEEVNVHDFPDKKLGKAAPYGVYDVAHNIGWVNVGISYDTAAFAVESIRRWWLRLGQELYPGASRRVEIFYGVNARIWANPVSCSHITFFVGCSLLPPNRKSTGIRTIRTTPTLRGANQSPRTETHTPNPLLPLDLHYSIRNVHPSRLLITADCGGSNGARVRLWKVELQELARELELEITVCHLPPGTSKWNRIEHRLFSFISQNWHQSELARQAAEDPRHHRQLDQRHHNQHRPQSLLRRGRERLSQGRGDRRCPNKCLRHPARGVPWRVELYLLADSSNRRGYCLTNPNVYKAPGSRNLQNCLEPCYCSVSDL